MNTCDCADVVIKYAADGEERYFPDLSMPTEWTMPKAAAKNTVTAMFMPRWASRITLEITDVRVQRVQAISVEDCIAEGMSTTLREHEACTDLVDQYHYLWDGLNAKRGFGWDANPWVWAISFRRVSCEG